MACFSFFQGDIALDFCQSILMCSLYLVVIYRIGKLMMVREFSIAVVLILVTALVILLMWRLRDHINDREEMNSLLVTQPTSPDAYSAAMVHDLPEQVQRYFNFTIMEGTPLYTVADITMQGQFSLGTKQAPNYLDMSAHQVLAAPKGFVWKTKAGNGLMQLSGSDSASWTRFWMAGLIPVARFGGNADHSLGAFGRYIAEAVFWSPAALLLQPGVTWEAVDKNTARVVVVYKGLEQSVDIHVSDTGQVIWVSFQRWSNANSAKVYQFQPFGGYVSDYREFEGFRLPTHVEAGNFFGTDEYFPFFIVDVTSIRFANIEP